MKTLNSSGFSLIEVLLAMVMVSVALGFSMDASRLLSWSKANSVRKDMASQVAINQMEELISTYSEDERLQNGQHAQGYDLMGIATGSNSPVYTANWVVARDTPINKILRIDLRVSWIDGDTSRGIQLISFRKY